MPEGDTVHLTARRLHAVFAGRPLTRAELRWPTLGDVDLTGRVTAEIVAVGKHLLHRFGGDRPVTLHSHLRMEGSWRLRPPSERVSPSAASVRALLGTEETLAVGRSLGMLDLVPARSERSLVGHLGPDLLAPEYDAEPVVAAMRADERPVGAVLLDQQVTAGMGTFWVAEMLFCAQISPWTPTSQYDGAVLAAVLTNGRELMQRAVQTGVQTTTGKRRGSDRGHVYGRVGLPCHRCGKPVRVAEIGVPPTDRMLFYCATCQGGLAPNDDGKPQQRPAPRRRNYGTGGF